MRDWETLYQKQGIVQREPSARVVEAVAFFRTAGLKTVLDLGCGTGRHTDLLCKDGFIVYGCDSSRDALCIARGMLPPAQFQQCDVGYLPYRDECLDGIICHAVIQHGTLATITGTIGEIHRILKRGALLFLTVISTNHPEYLTGQEIEPGTKINIDAIDGDMPHHYFTEEEIKSLFRDFAIIKLDHYIARSEKNPERMAATWALYASRQ
jgi:SAM-dependent methyltransferase